jgi:hypothetical protein
MFDLQTKTSLPLEFLEISSVWVRGGLGPVSVYWCKDTYQGKSEDSKLWTKVYEKEHAPSAYALVELQLTTPIRLQAGAKIFFFF